MILLIVTSGGHFRYEANLFSLLPVDLGLAVVGIILAIVGTQDAVIKYFDKPGDNSNISSGINTHIPVPPVPVTTH